MTTYRKEQMYKEIEERKYHADCPFDYEDGFKRGVEWADEHPNTEDIETVLAYTYKGLGWLAENMEFDTGTMNERALACTEILQLICNRAIMELRNNKTDNK